MSYFFKLFVIWSARKLKNKTNHRYLTNSDLPTDQTFHQFHYYTELDLHRIMSGFHGAFATGVASQQGTLTLPDTWFRPPFWDLPMLQLLRPNSLNLPCLYSTFHIEYPWYFLDFASSFRHRDNITNFPISVYTFWMKKIPHWYTFEVKMIPIHILGGLKIIPFQPHACIYRYNGRYPPTPVTGILILRYRVTCVTDQMLP